MRGGNSWDSASPPPPWKTLFLRMTEHGPSAEAGGSLTHTKATGSQNTRMETTWSNSSALPAQQAAVLVLPSPACCLPASLPRGIALPDPAGVLLWPCPPRPGPRHSGGKIFPTVARHCVNARKGLRRCSSEVSQGERGV